MRHTEGCSTESTDYRAYLVMGIVLLPIAPAVIGDWNSGKRPLLKGWQNKAFTTVGEILSWHERFPGHNIGALTGRVIVAIDCDHGIPERLRCDRTTQQTSGLEGHCTFLFTTPVATRSYTATWDGIPVEVKSRGSQIVIPDSIHWSGNRYHFANGRDMGSLLPCPDWLVEDMAAHRFLKSDGQSEPRTRDVRLPFHSHGCTCLEEIWRRPLEEGERDVGYYVLYQGGTDIGGNEPEYMAGLIRGKNACSSAPLPERELERIFSRGPERDAPGHTRSLGCSGVRSRLQGRPWFSCEGCRYANGMFLRRVGAPQLGDAARLSGSAAKAYLALLAKMRDTGDASMSIAEVRRLAGLSSQHTAVKALEELRAHGYL